MAAGCLVLALLTGSCVRPVDTSDARAGASQQPTPAPARPAEATGPTPAPDAAPTSDLFATSVRPILEAHCTCHFPGGKMYERLPFDKPETLASHREGALRRLKGDDRAAFEAWLTTLP
jgi:hypothetical protein